MSLLSCSINGNDITVDLTPGSKLAAAHGGADTVIEHTTCNYGLNRDVEQITSKGGMRAVGIDELGEIRAIERTDHRFFVATLYQPQLRSSPEAPHPLFASFVHVAAEQAPT